MRRTSVFNPLSVDRGLPSSDNANDISKLIIDAIHERQTIAFEAILNATQVPAAELRTRLNVLVNLGLVLRTGDTSYQLTPPGAEAQRSNHFRVR